MAFLIPENLANNKGVAAPHRRVGRALSVGLDDSATVWFEPLFEPEEDRKRPDFVVLEPSLGVIVVIVFEQSDGQEVLGSLKGELRVVDTGIEVSLDNPLQRADTFGHILRGKLAADPLLKDVPVEGLAAFPLLKRRAAEELGFDTVVDLDHCLFKEDIDSILQGDHGTVLTRTMLKVLEGGVADLMSDETQDRLRGIVHPEAVIATRPEQGSLFVSRSDDSAETLRVMDRKQEAFAKRIKSGHRVIRGVAGSGKTLILVARARLMSRVNPNGEILVTCFTKALASVLRAQLEDCTNVTVRHLDSLATELIKDAGLKHPGFKGPETQYAVALRAVELKEPKRYRAVLVDEAQDFDTDGLKLCVALADPRDGQMGDLLIVADSAQKIYDRKFSWKDAGIHAAGRTDILRRNYRNTKEILAFATDFIEADLKSSATSSVDVEPVSAGEENFDDEIVLVPAEAAERSGNLPVVEVVSGIESEVERVIRTVSNWYSPKLPARSIAVLMTSQRAGDRAQRVVDGLRKRDLPVFWVTESADSRDRVGMVDEPIVVSTVHSAKGLEFANVAMCGLGDSTTGDAAVRSRNTLYVGFTRAIDELAVVTTDDNPFAASLSSVASAHDADED